MYHLNVALLVTTIVAVLVAVASLVLFASSRPPGDDSPEAGFARDMMVHHAQAIGMAEMVRDKTENEAIRVLAKEIALTQRGEIGHMQGWLAVWGLPDTRTGPAMGWMGHPTSGTMPGLATPEELNRLREAPPKQADTLFLLLMIPHHRAAVPMAEAVLDRTDRPEVRRLAEYMAASQQQEIELMRNMLRQKGMAPVEVELTLHRDNDASGTATFEGSEGGVEVGLEFRNLPDPDTTYLAHVHFGSCDTEDKGHGHGTEDGEIEHPLSPIDPDQSGNGSSKSVLEGVTLDDLFSEQPAYVNVHAAGAEDSPQLACADLSVANVRTAYNVGTDGAVLYPGSG